MPVLIRHTNQPSSRVRAAAPARWTRRRLFTACVALLAGASLLSRAQDRSTELQVKAVFLLNFLQFVEWPPQAFGSPDAPVRIAVLGEDPFGAVLDEVVRGEKLGKRPIDVVRARRWEDVRNCQLVFVSQSERSRLGEILQPLEGAPILLVSDLPDFTRRGGVIRFFLEGNKVRFEINLPSAQRRGLKLSSQLLSVARVAPTAARGDQ